MPTKPRFLKEGVHRVTVIKAELGESMSGKERVEVTFEDGAKLTATRHLYLTPKAMPYTAEALEILGLNSEDTNYVDMLDTMVGREAIIKVAVASGPAMLPEVVAIWPTEENRTKPSQDELKARIKKLLTEKPVSAPVSAPADDPADCIEEPQS